MTDEERCGAECRDGSPCQNYPVEGSDRCRMHGGQSTGGDGAPEGNTNSVSHGAYADQSNLYNDVFSDAEREIADDIFENYHTRYTELHGDIPTGHELRLFKIAVNAVTEIRVENWATDRPESLNTGTPHVDEETHKKTVQAPDGSVQVIKEKRYKKSPALAAKKTLSNENRQWLKDLGLLDDPQSQTAENIGDLASIIADES